MRDSRRGRAALTTAGEPTRWWASARATVRSGPALPIGLCKPITRCAHMPARQRSARMVRIRPAGGGAHTGAGTDTVHVSRSVGSARRWPITRWRWGGLEKAEGGGDSARGWRGGGLYWSVRRGLLISPNPHTVLVRGSLRGRTFGPSGPQERGTWAYEGAVEQGVCKRECEQGNRFLRARSHVSPRASRLSSCAASSSTRLHGLVDQTSLPWSPEQMAPSSERD